MTENVTPAAEKVVENLQHVQQRIAAAAQQAGRDSADVALLAVSKTKPIELITAAYQAGQRRFGENYLQEAVDKVVALRHLDIEWHFIGPLQSNKTRNAAQHFDWVHTIDRIKIARRLSEQRPAELPPLNICLQVNIDGEASKSGVTTEQLPALAAEVAALPNLTLRGLMAIPKASDDPNQQREPFAALAALLQQLRELLPEQHKIDTFQLDTLSMGMSGDMDAAISEGATMVRIGTDIFGARDYSLSSSLKTD